MSEFCIDLKCTLPMLKWAEAINCPLTVIQVSFRDFSLLIMGTKSSLCPSPIPVLDNTACDPVIEEHFRRSLGKNYKEPESTATNSVSITGSVDDHFAKALGETWLQIKNKGSPSSSSSSPNSSPDSHMVNHNHSPSVVSWRGRGLRGFCPFPQPPQSSRLQHPCPHHFGLSPASLRECLPAGLLKTSKTLKPALSFYALIEDLPSNNNMAVFLLLPSGMAMPDNNQ